MLLEQGQRVKSKVKPVYDFATLQQACYPDWSLHIDTAVATAGYAWIARAAPTICYGVDKSNRWYMQWAGQLLDACQRCVNANPQVFNDCLQVGYTSRDKDDPHKEYIHLVGTKPGFNVAIYRRPYDALVADDDRLIAVQHGLDRTILVVRRRLVMAATKEAGVSGYVPVIDDSRTLLPDIASHWPKRRRK